MGILDRKHTDWPWPFSLIPRRWTALFWDTPRLVRGNLRPQDFVSVRTEKINPENPLSYVYEFAPKPITSEGTWQLSRFPHGPWYAWYFAWSGKKAKDGFYRHFRIGARWDDVDGYTQFPSFAFPWGRRYNGTNDQDTSVR